MRSSRVPKPSLGCGFLPFRRSQNYGRHTKDCFAQDGVAEATFAVHAAVTSQ